MKSLGIVPESTMLSARSKYWNYGETESGRNPAWDSLSTERRQDLARRMAIYAAMIDRMDQQIGRVLGNLKEQGEFKNTLILFLSDNGACAEWDPRGFDGKSSNHNVLHRGDALESEHPSNANTRDRCASHVHRGKWLPVLRRSAVTGPEYCRPVNREDDSGTPALL